jgi:Domain of unknown function (DUF4062)
MKVYISSTYADLRDHRQAVALTLRRMGHDVVGMEEYAAESMTPLARCLTDVRNADVYVVIVAWRYGYVPGNPATNPARRSITELEYEAATGPAEKPVLAFLLDPAAAWPASAMDALTEVGGTAIQDFRTRLGSTYLAGIFTTPDNLATQVAAAIAVQGINRHMAERALTPEGVGAVMAPFVEGGPLQDTTVASIEHMVGGAGNTLALLIDVAEHTWWSTRLYLLATLVQALTPVRQFVFCEGADVFAGMASPSAVRDGLREAFPQLATFDTQLRQGPSTQDVKRETDRAIMLWNQHMGAIEANTKVDVRSQLLVEWLGERLIRRCIRIEESGLTMMQVQQIVDSLIPDVPVQRRNGGPRAAEPDPPTPKLVVVDRDAYALELAREWVRATSPRAPAP